MKPIIITKNKTLKFLALLLTLNIVINFTACKEKGCTDSHASNYNADAKKDDGSCITDDHDHNHDDQSGTTTMKINVSHKVGAQNFAYNTNFSDCNGRKYQFSKVQFYSSIMFKNHDGNFKTPSDGGGYLLVSPDDIEYNLGVIESNHYHGLSFNVGVDSITNHADPAILASTHPLSADNNKFSHWGWNSGYKFIVLEGLVDTSKSMSGTVDAPFVFHIGTDALYRKNDFTKHFDADSAATYTLNLTIDWSKFFDGINLRTDNNATTLSPLATTVADNGSGSISIQ